MSATLSFIDVREKRDSLWEHCRNSLAMARLLAQEGRSTPWIVTACQCAVETACRAALEQRGERYDGDLVYAFARLDAPLDLWEPTEERAPQVWLNDAQRAVGWLSTLLRQEAPERSWGY